MSRVCKWSSLNSLIVCKKFQYLILPLFSPLRVDSAICEIVAKKETVSTLFSILSWASKFESGLLVNAAKTICHVAQMEKNKELVAAEGGLAILIGALDSQVEDLQFWAAQTIQNLCTGMLLR